MSKKHARLSPSSADRWTSCTASPAAQDGIPNSNSDASRMGTVCHQIAEECLLDDSKSPADFIGRKLVFWRHDESGSSGCDWSETFETMVNGSYDGGLLVVEAEVEVTEDMVAAVATGVAFVREQHMFLGGKMLIEQRVPVGQFTGEDDAFGSADVILLGDTWISVIDFKFGRKRVHASKLAAPQRVDFITGAVLPEQRGPNLQMACYALGAVHANDVFGEITTVTMTIVQPFLGFTDSYTCSIDELNATERFLSTKAAEVETNPVFSPSFDNCLFCLAKGNCDAQARKVLTTVFDMFDDHSGVLKQPGVPSLGSQYALVHFVEQWAKDVVVATGAALAAGEPVVRDDGLSYKLVVGKKSARQWTDEAAATDTLTKARLRHDQMYSYSLISPAQAEQLAKVKKAKKGEPAVEPVLNKTQWSNLAALIEQHDGNPQIALETDPRPAITRADGFTDN